MKISKDMKISDVTKKYPDTLNIFGNFRIDFCCGGGRTIEEAAKSKNINIDNLLNELNGGIKMEEKKEQENKCLACGATSKEVVLLKCVRNEEEEHVCVHCLPALIHGA